MRNIDVTAKVIYMSIYDLFILFNTLICFAISICFIDLNDNEELLEKS